jgi:GntR family transcriptional repressor for pyruvate dehydrogenase complex
VAEGNPAIAPVERVNVHNVVMERIVTYILGHGLRPGDKLPTERELTAMLGVGRSSLREATRSLAAMGIIRIAPRGMYVSGGESAVLTQPIAWGLLLSAHSAREVIEARRVVETSLAASAAVRATQDDIDRLATALELMRETVVRPEEFVAHDLEFHLEVAHAGHNVILLHIVRTIQLVIRAWIEKVIREYEHTPVSFDEHRLIHEAIVARNPEAAAEAMGDHLSAAGSRLLKTIPDTEEGDTIRAEGVSSSSLGVIAPGLADFRS